MIAPGVHVTRSAVHDMASGIVLPAASGRTGAAGGALLVDPGVLPSEIGRIEEILAAAGCAPGTIVLTHSDWDHVAGAGRWPEARVLASAAFPGRAAARAAEIAAGIAAAAVRHGVPVPGAFVLPSPAGLIGSDSEIVGAPRPARALPAPGHTPDGVAVLLTDEGILFAGDYLSATEIPFVEDSAGAYLRTLGRFRRLLTAGAVRNVVPGHGPVLGSAEAARILEEDERYLRALVAAAAGAARRGAPESEALEAARAVRVPRCPGDPEVLRGHAANAAMTVAGSRG